MAPQRRTHQRAAALHNAGTQIKNPLTVMTGPREDPGTTERRVRPPCRLASGDWAIRKRVDLWSRLALHSANRPVEHAASREDMMSVQPLRKEGHQNPRTAEEAKALVKQVESLFMPWNIDALVSGFTDDCIVRFGTVRSFAVATRCAPSSPRAAASRRATASRKASGRWSTTPSPTSGKVNGRTPRRAPPCAASALKSGSCATARSRCGREHSIPGAPTRRTASPTFCADLICPRIGIWLRRAVGCLYPVVRSKQRHKMLSASGIKWSCSIIAHSLLVSNCRSGIVVGRTGG